MHILFIYSNYRGSHRSNFFFTLIFSSCTAVINTGFVPVGSWNKDDPAISVWAEIVFPVTVASQFFHSAAILFVVSSHAMFDGIQTCSKAQ